MITVMCFSKDRPLQLEGYLRSLFRSSGMDLPTAVIYSAGRAFAGAYREVAAEFPQVRFIPEENLAVQVSRFVEETRTALFMWGCDDVVFKRPWEPRSVETAFLSFPELFAFSLRLGEEVTYCYSASMAQRPPSFLATTPQLLWDWTEADVEWGYPWELTCSVYPTVLVKKMLQLLSEADRGHPNLLEGIGAARLGQMKEHRLMAAYPEARANVVTVNRVQDVVENRVYENGMSSVELLRRWRRGERLDVEAYAERRYPSAHIGELLLRGPGRGAL